jgi:3-hydroxyacyl-[acyl-carrier-protein] dehydratase
MIDRVTDYEPGVFANGYKNFTNNEWFFPVHFPGAPNVPGALQLEAMAQMLTVALTTIDGLEGSVTHAMKHTVRFRKEVLPGDRFEISAKVLSWSRGVCTGSATSHVDGKIVSEAEMTITIPEILKSYLPKS